VKPLATLRSIDVATTCSQPQIAAHSGRSPIQGLRIDLSTDGLLVVEEQSVWFVEHGEIDLFVMAATDGLLAGPRQHVMRLTPGRIFMGLGAGDHPHEGLRVVAVARGPAQLVRCPRTTLDVGPGLGSTGRSTRDLLDAWIEDLYEGLAGGRFPQDAVSADAGREVVFDAPTVLRPRSGVQWIFTLSGRSLLQGRSDLAVEGEGCFPLSVHSWLEVQPRSRLYVSSTERLNNVAAIWAGIARLGHMVCAQSARLLRERVAALGQQTQTASADQAAADDDSKATAAAALVSCCIRIGNALGVVVNSPPPADVGSVARDPLEAILQRSPLRARKVALRGSWWRRDHGPLLAWAIAGQRPVALLRGRSSYVCHHDDGSTVVLDERAALSLAPFGFTFQASLPAAGHGVWGLLRFAARGSQRDAFIFALLSLMVSALSLFPSLAVGLLFNHVIPSAERSQLLPLTVVLVVCAVAGSCFGLVKGFALLRIQQRIGTALQAAVWDRLMRLPLPFFRAYAAGDLATRAMAIDGIHQILSAVTINALVGAVFSLVNLTLMFLYSPPLALRGLALIAVAIGVTVLGSLLQLRPQRQMIQLRTRLSGLVFQLLASTNKLRAAGAEARAFSLWAARFERQRQVQVQIRRTGNWMRAFSGGVPLLAAMVLFWSATPMLGKGDASMGSGDFLAFQAAFTTCLAALLATSRALVSTLETLPLYEQARPILMGQPEVHEGLADPGELAGGIEVHNATFRYHEDAPPVLEDISLRIQPGEFIAIVGPSGSGKSTLLRLLLGFEKLESGSIFFDDQDLSGLDVQALRRRIGVVLQNGRLMPGDIFTNICGPTRRNIDDAWAAAEVASIAADIRAMPMEMHTIVGEGATTFSGGQRQRLMIARAIVHRPKILLFDEATSALDNRTQALISASLETMKATRIVVAHRLSTIINADRIVVIEAGRIVQCGTYRQLMSEGGAFAQLARCQMVE
jgi:NHLM bacteriocin system ABC transporter ATP-binding protein